MRQELEQLIADKDKNQIVLNMGPQHPATHGVCRLLITLDGEYITDVKPIIGYLHRGKEKTAERLTFMQFLCHTDRLDYLNPMLNNVGYMLAVEKLGGIEVPPRCKYIRVMVSELARISSHLLWLATTALDIGAMTVYFYCFDTREKIYNIFEHICGARFTTSYTRVGGLRNDVTQDNLDEIKALLDHLPGRMKELRGLLSKNEIWLKRTVDVGILSKETALAYGVTGPNARASGIPYDVRKARPYSGYEEFDFDMALQEKGDTYARYLVRLQEIDESAKIVRQCVENMPSGPINADLPKVVLPPKVDVLTKMEELINHFKIVTEGPDLPEGEIYQGVESSKGELGFTIIHKAGGKSPWRLKIHSPSFVNIQLAGEMLKGQLIADAVAIFASLDPVMGEADK